MKSTSAKEARPNLNSVDLRYQDAAIGPLLVEVKPCDAANVRYAIRTAIGQLLDYRQDESGTPACSSWLKLSQLPEIVCSPPPTAWVLPILRPTPSGFIGRVRQGMKAGSIDVISASAPSGNSSVDLSKEDGISRSVLLEGQSRGRCRL